MARHVVTMIAAFAWLVQSILLALAQGFPLPGPPPIIPMGPAPFPPIGPGPVFNPLARIDSDSPWAPICIGFPEPGFGPAPCFIVEQELEIRNRLGDIFPTLVPFPGNPGFAPVCAGPLGPGPCILVARWIAMQQIAQQHLPALMVIDNVPGIGDICTGPLGPGPCEAVRLYLMQASLGTGLMQPFDLRTVRVDGSLGKSQEALCDGHFGKMPCALLGQIGLDRIGANTVPPRSSFGLPDISDPRQLARQCAQRTGLDIGAFASCTGQKVILPARQQELLTCAVSSHQTENFATCAAEATGLRLSEDQRILANCAMRAKGNASAFSGCAGNTFSGRALTPDQQAVVTCAAKPGATAETFISCAAPRFLNGQQKAVLDCAAMEADAAAFALCAAPNAGVKMSDDQRILARCAMSSKGDTSAFAACAGTSFIQRGLGPREQAVIACAAGANGDRSAFVGCAASKLVGGNLSPEQQVALRCTAESGGDPASFGGCAAANMFSLQLNPEQQIAVQCVVSTGGQPYAAAGCIASRLTLRELTKCMTDGFGGDGCFGDNNDLVGRNGFVGRTLGQIAGGPNSVINNPNQIWGGDNSFVRNPGQILGGPNSFVRNPSQIFGGPNSVFNNPSQLLPQPRPVQLGSIGGKRICLPWC